MKMPKSKCCSALPTLSTDMFGGEAFKCMMCLNFTEIIWIDVDEVIGPDEEAGE